MTARAHRSVGCRWVAGVALAVSAGCGALSADLPDLALRAFETVPVLESGRPMPAAAFADVVMLQMAGRRTWEGGPSSRWLARVMFESGSTTNDAVFLISHPDTFAALGLSSARVRRRAAYSELAPALVKLDDLADRAAAMKAEDRTPVDQDLLRLRSSLGLYAAMIRGEHPGILPMDGGHGRWLTLAEAHAAPGASDLTDAWAAMRDAWTTGDAERFRGAAAAARRAVVSRLDDPRAAARLDTELRMHRLRLFPRSLALYALAAALGFWAALRSGRRRAILAGAVLVGLALVLHTGGLALRTFIMARPPVTNLYSTFVFASWCCAAIGLWIERGRRDGMGLFAGGLMGAVLLAVAARYAMEGDTMRRLVAVLDSTLWLSAHVLTIMVGYAGCLMAGAAGHVVLVRRVRASDADCASAGRMTRGLLAFGLVFTFIGTMLGGVWADQSWGRFWGWDPKENGALLIILWISAALHARASHLIGDPGLAAAAVFSNVVVVFAWLGVNLLGVGLHSYGFTTGAALGLLLFAAAETLFALGFLAAIRRSGRLRSPASD